MDDPLDELRHPVDTPLEHALIIGAELMRTRAAQLEATGDAPGYVEQLRDLAGLLDLHLPVIRTARELGTPLRYQPDGQVTLVDP